jgi:hypothetical protein
MDATMWRVSEKGQGISRRQEMPSPAARSSQPAPLYRPPATAHPNLGLGLDGRGRPRMRAGWKTEGTRVEVGRLVGNEREGMREETEESWWRLTCPVRRRGALEQARSETKRLSTNRYATVSRQFRSLRGRKRSKQWMEFGLLPMEFGPNSRAKFHATPNTRIRVQILQFQFPGPILCIQTGCRSKQGLRVVLPRDWDVH